MKEGLRRGGYTEQDTALMEEFLEIEAKLRPYAEKIAKDLDYAAGSGACIINTPRLDSGYPCLAQVSGLALHPSIFEVFHLHAP